LIAKRKEVSTIKNMNVTEAASSKINDLIAKEGRDDLVLRVSVSPGGCAGLRYSLYFDQILLPEDQIIEKNGQKVVIDKLSSPYLSNATLDYKDEISKQGFTIDNPDAQGSCACGESFS